MQLRDVVGYLFDFGIDVLVTTLDKATGVITAQLGDSSTNTPDAANAEWWQHTGFSSRAAKPTQGGASCQVCTLKKGDRDIAFISRDTRGTAIYGNLADGEACVYAPGSQAREVFKADGSVRAMTTDDNTPTGNVVWTGISPTYQSLSGPAPGGEWRYYAPWGGAWHDPSGYHLRTWHGVKIDAGGIGLPSPFPGGGSSYTLSANNVSLDAAMLTLGRNNGTGQSLLQALPSQVALQTITTALTALEVAVAAFTGTGTFPGLPAAATLIATATAAVAGMSVSCATKATTAT